MRRYPLFPKESDPPSQKAIKLFVIAFCLAQCSSHLVVDSPIALTIHMLTVSIAFLEKGGFFQRFCQQLGWTGQTRYRTSGPGGTSPAGSKGKGQKKDHYDKDHRIVLPQPPPQSPTPKKPAPSLPSGSEDNEKKGRLIPSWFFQIPACRNIDFSIPKQLFATAAPTIADDNRKGRIIPSWFFPTIAYKSVDSVSLVRLFLTEPLSPRSKGTNSDIAEVDLTASSAVLETKQDIAEAKKKLSFFNKAKAKFNDFKAKRAEKAAFFEECKDAEQDAIERITHEYKREGKVFAEFRAKYGVKKKFRKKWMSSQADKRATEKAEPLLGAEMGDNEGPKQKKGIFASFKARRAEKKAAKEAADM